MSSSRNLITTGLLFPPPTGQDLFTRNDPRPFNQLENPPLSVTSLHTFPMAVNVEFEAIPLGIIIEPYHWTFSVILHEFQVHIRMDLAMVLSPV